MAKFRIPTVSIVGGESLLGREVRDLLNGIKPAPDVRTISSEVDSTQVARDEEGDAIVLAALDEETLADSNVVVLASSAEASRKALSIVEEAGADAPALIDLTGVLEDHPGAKLRAPMLEGMRVSGSAGIQVAAHPAAVALALVYRRIVPRFAVQRSIVEIFEPASERGQRGLTEMQTQTVNLLSFKPLPKEVYDAQVSFNMLAAYGSEAQYSLAEAEARIERHLATYLLAAPGMPMPSLRLIQAPVFHGYSCSIWMEFAQTPDIAALEEAIASAQIEVRRADEEPPNNVAVAGEDGVTVGGIREDRNHPRACWLWLATDNIRMTAAIAVAVAKEYL